MSAGVTVDTSVFPAELLVVALGLLVNGRILLKVDIHEVEHVRLLLPFPEHTVSQVELLKRVIYWHLK